MMFKKLQKFFGAEPHPSMQWPQLEIQTPAFQTSTRAVADLTFGSGIDGAMMFGAPDEVRPLDGGGVNLVYAKAGFQLEFDQDSLTCVAFFVSKDEYQPDTPGLTHCEPIVDGHKFGPSHSPAQVQDLLGAPKSVDEDEDETILDYERNGLTLEFEFTAAGALKRLSLFHA